MTTNDCKYDTNTDAQQRNAILIFTHVCIDAKLNTTRSTMHSYKLLVHTHITNLQQ